MVEVKKINGMYTLERDLTVEELKELEEDESFDDFELHRAVGEWDEEKERVETYDEQEGDEAPEGLSYEEDGIYSFYLVGPSGEEIAYSEMTETEEDEHSFSNIPKYVSANHLVLLEGEDPETEGPVVFVSGDDVDEFVSMIEERLPVSLEMSKAEYYVEDDEVLSDEDGHCPKTGLDLDEEVVRVRDNHLKLYGDNDEKAAEILNEALETLREDENWMPEVKWHRRVTTGTVDVSEDVEIEEREEDVLNEETFYDIPLSDDRNLSFLEMEDEAEGTVILGQSKESCEDARAVLEDVNEVEGVEVEIDEDDTDRDTAKFKEYDFPE